MDPPKSGRHMKNNRDIIRELELEIARLNKRLRSYEKLITRKCPRPECDGYLLVKHNKKTGSEFLGCSEYRITGCDYTQKIPGKESRSLNAYDDNLRPNDPNSGFWNSKWGRKK